MWLEDILYGALASGVNVRQTAFTASWLEQSPSSNQLPHNHSTGVIAEGSRGTGWSSELPMLHAEADGRGLERCSGVLHPCTGRSAPPQHTGCPVPGHTRLLPSGYSGRSADPHQLVRLHFSLPTLLLKLSPESISTNTAKAHVAESPRMGPALKGTVRPPPHAQMLLGVLPSPI